MTELLTVRNVRKSFGDHLVLRDISFDVPAGCPAQNLTIAGSAADLPQQADVTVSALSLTREALAHG